MELIYIVIVIGLCFSFWGLKVTYDYTKYHKEIKAIKKELNKELNKEIENVKREIFDSINYEFGDVLEDGSIFISKMNGDFSFISYNPNNKQVDYNGLDMGYITKKAEKNIALREITKEIQNKEINCYSK